MLQEENLYFVACAAVFVALYSVTIIFTSIGYHRGLCHGAVELHPWARWFLGVMGNWVTGVDAKAWVVMHRLHHRHSDTPLDPHSPRNVGLGRIIVKQLDSYNEIRWGIAKGDARLLEIGKDMEFPLSWPLRARVPFLPYIIHMAIGAFIGWYFGMWLLGAAYFLGILSHGWQGALVNSLGHAIGPRNFDLPDDSRNNAFAAYFILGEGYQNNHHKFPASARFSWLPSEVDFGYGVCRVLEVFGILRICRDTLSDPSRAAQPVVAAGGVVPEAPTPPLTDF